MPTANAKTQRPVSQGAKPIETAARIANGLRSICTFSNPVAGRLFLDAPSPAFVTFSLLAVLSISTPLHLANAQGLIQNQTVEHDGLERVFDY